MQPRWRGFGKLCARRCQPIRISHSIRATLHSTKPASWELRRTISSSASTCLQPPPRSRRKDVISTPDTIYALSSAPGRAAIAIVRVSGPACLDIYGGLCPDKPFPGPRHATVRKLLDPLGQSRVLDPSALVLYFPARNTVTGEDVLEFHVHGGPAVVRSILDAIPKCTDTRPRRRAAEYSVIRAAEPGEFTKRAFYNGRVDLTQAEALGEILAAETQQQQRLAVAGAENNLSTRYESWHKVLLEARGELEALIDFSEDQHFDESPAEFMESISKQVVALRREIHIHVKNANRGELLRNGINVALLGAPNAGKSSLLNQIVGREAAIVSSEAGTTRDIVDISIDLGGWLVRLGDMAGLRGDSSAPVQIGQQTSIGLVEKEGMRRARARAIQSDLVIVLISLERSAGGSSSLALNTELADAVQECSSAGKKLIFVVNKTDLIQEDTKQDSQARLRRSVCAAFPTIDVGPDEVFFVSCKDAAKELSEVADADPGGLQNFLLGLQSTFSAMTSAATGNEITSDGSAGSRDSMQDQQAYWNLALSVTHRQSAYLQQCIKYLDEYLTQTDPPSHRTQSQHDRRDHGASDSETTYHASPSAKNALQPMYHLDGHDDLVGSHEADFDIAAAAEHLRGAADCLARITGRFAGGDVEDVLGVVFEK